MDRVVRGAPGELKSGGRFGEAYPHAKRHVESIGIKLWKTGIVAG